MEPLIFDVEKVFNFMKIKLVEPKKSVKAGLAVLSSAKYCAIKFT
jgi:hypothetical protein